MAWAAVSALYLGWRAAFTLDPEHPTYAMLFFVAELFCILSSAVFYTLIVRRGELPRPAPGPSPSVDVFICTYNEDPDLLRTTAVAARDMEGPHQTWLCDDGNRPEVAALAAAIGVGYLSRPSNAHFKAGNLNHALAHTSAELVLVLDADHVPRRQMLLRITPFFADPRLALVQTPQVYYNVDSYQHDLSVRERSLWHEASVFHHLMQPGASRLNASFFVGTGAVLRRSALVAVGGFATGSITEDIHTSMRLHDAGFSSLYLDEALGYLLAPDTPVAFAAQRLRWAQGAMQILRRENPLGKRGLSGWQRMAYLNSLAGYLAAWQHLIFYLAPGIFALTGVSPIAVDPTVGLPLFVAHIVADLVVYRRLAAPHARLFLSECYKTLTVAIYIRATAALLFPSELPFRVTPKGSHSGLPLAILLPAAGLFAFNLTAVGVGLVRLARGESSPGALVLASFFAGLFACACALALLHAWERRRAHEPFAFPVRIEAAPGVVIRRLNHRVAYAAVGPGVTTGDVVDLAGSPLGLAAPVRATVESVADDGAERVARLSLAALSGADRDAIDRLVFGSALPAFFARFGDASSAPPPETRLAGVVEPADFLRVRSGLL
jgi:cellulose synthase (UDP-forming)